MFYSIGDWVKPTLCPDSTPMMVVSRYGDGNLLCSKAEYGGDWKIINSQLARRVHPTPIEALSIMSGYNEAWWYNNPILRRCFQETLIIALASRGVKADGGDNNQNVPPVE